MNEVLRYRHPNIRALELWNVVSGTGIISDQLHAADAGLRVSDFIAQLLEGSARREGEGQPALPANSFSSVCLCGGRAAQIYRSLVQRPLSCTVELLEGDSFSAAAAARFLNNSSVGQNVLLDIGQTSIKGYCADKQVLLERDLDQLPGSDSRLPLSSDIETQRECFAEFVLSALDELCVFGKELANLYIALPAEIGNGFSIGRCTYVAIDANGSLFAQRLARLGVRAPKLWLANDAEISALSVLLERRELPRPTLVLTLGRGVGAAMIDRVEHE